MAWVLRTKANKVLCRTVAFHPLWVAMREYNPEGTVRTETEGNEKRCYDIDNNLVEHLRIEKDSPPWIKKLKKS